ncbi:unnamed protein product, partial [Prorocentrum cordatum]
APLSVKMTAPVAQLSDVALEGALAPLARARVELALAAARLDGALPAPVAQALEAGLAPHAGARVEVEMALADLLPNVEMPMPAAWLRGAVFGTVLVPLVVVRVELVLFLGALSRGALRVLVAAVSDALSRIPRGVKMLLPVAQLRNAALEAGFVLVAGVEVELAPTDAQPKVGTPAPAAALSDAAFQTAFVPRLCFGATLLLPSALLDVSLLAQAAVLADAAREAALAPPAGVGVELLLSDAPLHAGVLLAPVALPRNAALEAALAPLTPVRVKLALADALLDGAPLVAVALPGGAVSEVVPTCPAHGRQSQVAPLQRGAQRRDAMRAVAVRKYVGVGTVLSDALLNVSAPVPVALRGDAVLEAVLAPLAQVRVELVLADALLKCALVATVVAASDAVLKTVFVLLVGARVDLALSDAMLTKVEMPVCVALTGDVALEEVLALLESVRVELLLSSALLDVAMSVPLAAVSDLMMRAVPFPLVDVGVEVFAPQIDVWIELVLAAVLLNVEMMLLVMFLVPAVAENVALEAPLVSPASIGAKQLLADALLHVEVLAPIMLLSDAASEAALVFGVHVRMRCWCRSRCSATRYLTVLAPFVDVGGELLIPDALSMVEMPVAVALPGDVVFERA